LNSNGKVCNNEDELEIDFRIALSYSMKRAEKLLEERNWEREERESKQIEKATYLSLEARLRRS